MFRRTPGALSLSFRLFAHLGRKGWPLPFVLYPHYPKQGIQMRVELEETRLGRVLKINPLYILDAKSGVPLLIARKTWQIFDEKKDAALDGHPNGYAWQNDCLRSWDTSVYADEARLLEQAALSDNWTEVYKANNISHQASPEFPGVVRRFNNEEPWEEKFCLLQWSDFYIPTGMKPIEYRVYYLMAMHRPSNANEQRTSLVFAGIEDPGVVPLIAEFVPAVPVRAAA